jgi:alpha-1,2-mannosyltransferase
MRLLAARPHQFALLFLACGLASIAILLPVVWSGHGLIDLQVYRFGVQAWLSGHDVYKQLPTTSAGISLPYLYPPFSLAVFTPLTVVPWKLSMLFMTALSMIALIASVHVVITRVWSAGDHRGTAALTATAIPLTLALEPVRETLSFGQVNLWLMALVVLDCLGRARWWPRGLLIGLAIAIKLTPAVFVLFFLLRRDFRAAAVSVASAAAFFTLGFVLAWRDSISYWLTGGGPAADLRGSPFSSNQALAGALSRFGPDPLWDALIWALVAAVMVRVCVLVVPRVNAPSGLVVTAAAGLVISPISWSHHWVWIVPALIVCAAHVARRRQHLLGSAVGLALVATVFIPGPHNYAPVSGDDELNWTWWQHLTGNAYLLVALSALLGVAALRRHRRLPPAETGRHHLVVDPL